MYSSVSWLIRKCRSVVALLVATLLMVGFAVTPAEAATGPVVVSFTFDNQWANQMTAAQILHSAGMPGTFYVISGWIGAANFMSMSDLQTLVSFGDEIGGKTVDNTDLPTVSDAEAQRDRLVHHAARDLGGRECRLGRHQEDLLGGEPDSVAGDDGEFALPRLAGCRREDELARAEKELDALTRAHVDAIDEALKRKEAELLEV